MNTEDHKGLPAVHASMRRAGVKIAGIALAYFFAHHLAFFFPDSQNIIMLVWPAGGIGLAAFLLNPRRLWPLLTVAFYIAGIAANVFLGHRSFFTGLGYMTANMIESLGCAALILYWAKEFRNFRQVKEVLALIVGAIFINAVSASIGAVTSVFTRSASFWASWQSWYIADGLGILLVGPFIVTWMGVEKTIVRAGVKRILEGVAFISLWVLVNLLVFAFIKLPPDFGFHPYVLVALQAWAALRLGPRGVTLALMLLFTIAVGSPAIISGPSPLDGQDVRLAHRLLELQMFLGFLAITGYLLAAGYADLQRAVKELKTSEERLRFHTDNSPLAVVEWDADFIVTRWTGAAEKIFGWPPQEVLGKPIMDLHMIYEADIQIVQNVMLRLTDGISKHVVSTNRNRTKDGRIIHCEWCNSVRHDEAGKMISVMSQVLDITERKKAEEGLRESHSKLVKLTAQVPGVVYQYRLYPDGRSAFPFASPGMNDIYEVTPAEVQEDATPVFGRLHPEDHERVGNLIYESARTLQPFHCEFRVTLPRQGLRWRLSDALPERMEDGGTLWHGIISDITERKLLEEQLRQAQKLESIGQLAGGIAHDYNNLLASTMMNLGVLRDNPNLDAEGRETVRELTVESQRAANLTRQLLLFSRRSVMEMKVLNLNELVANLLKMLGRLLGEHITIEFAHCGHLPLVEADAGMLEQVVMNLAVNARDAMPNGGRLTFSMEPIQVAAERIKGNVEVRPGPFVCLTVTDTGCGMEPATLKRIFEPFFTTKEVGKGTGLGLATTYGIVAQHKGWVEVESALGQGTTFRVYLPTLVTGY